MLVSINEAIEWASNYLNKKISKHNIQYLINYGEIEVYNGKIELQELKKYYDKFKNDKDWNHELSFANLTESERTKHVHKLHPYKGKYIPQLVEYFLNNYFNPDDIVLDPFCGSGTTLIQANEQNIHSIGIELSPFNCMITEFKTTNFDIDEFNKQATELLKLLEKNYDDSVKMFEKELKTEITNFNKSIDSKQIRLDLKNKNITKTNLKKIEDSFLELFDSLIKKYDLTIYNPSPQTFTEKWYTLPIQQEIAIIKDYIQHISNEKQKNNLIVFVSRVIRSVRATKHTDLEKLKEPVYKPYFCLKHFKICKPNYTLIPTYKKYLKDTIKRLKEYQTLKTNAFQEIINGDSRYVDILKKINNQEFKQIIKEKGIDGIITSPPYFGQLNYHEQHEYAYDIFGIEKQEKNEIGSTIFGKSKKAKEKYILDMTEVFSNSTKYLKKNSKIIIIVDDKDNLYDDILNNAGIKIIEKKKRPVLNRTSRDNKKYYEDIIIAIVE